MVTNQSGKIGYIYRLIDPVDNKIRYVGQTINKLNVRLNKHICDSKKVKNYTQCWIRGLVLKGLIPKIELLIQCDINCLDEYEVFYINLYKSSGLLLTNIENGGNAKKIISEETKHNIRAALKGKKQSDYTKNKRAEVLKNVWKNPELIELKRKQTTDLIKKGVISCGRGIESKKKGKPFKGDKSKISSSLRDYFSCVERRNQVAERNGQRKFSVYKIASIKRGNRFRGKSELILGDKIYQFCNVNEAARVLKIAQATNIRNVLRGKRQSCRNYFFKYD